MHFKSGQGLSKATLEIGDKTYKIKAPSVGQSTALVESLEEFSGKTVEQSKLMKEFICELGSIPMEELNLIENELFNELFDYVITPKKK